jgi:hypothetical protein
VTAEAQQPASSERKPASEPAAATRAGDAAAPPVSLDAARDANWRQFAIETALEVLRYYADCGDVQTCVTMQRVLGADVEARLGQRRVQQWLVQYIDLLHRLQLWAPASTVMARCSDEAIRRLNQMHTALQPACTACGTDVTQLPPPDTRPRPEEAVPARADGPPPQPGAGVVTAIDALWAAAPVATLVAVRDEDEPADAPRTLVVTTGLEPVSASASAVGVLQAVAPAHCGGCADVVSACAVCRLPVRGLYVWCQGCGHGGHLQHMQDWFAAYGSLCPTGCQHVCNLSARPPAPALSLSEDA